jgi:cephalosporin-C deacetylase-like acetyl esterase
MKKFAFALSLLLAFSIASFSQNQDSQFVGKFDYDNKIPLDVQETAVETRDGVKIYTVSYASLKGGRVPAYLIVPEKKGKYAAILFGHWAMNGSQFANKTEFLDEAVVLAKAGVVSLLPDAVIARPGFVKDEDFFSESIPAQFFQQILDLRRGIDLLAARKDVDAKRIGYVGHSYNSNAGGVLTGIEKRIKAFVLMASGLSDEIDVLSDEPVFVEIRKKYGEEKVRGLMTKYAYLDPVHYVKYAAPSAVFLQYGKNDGHLSRRAQHYFSLVSEPKEMKIYDAGHALNAQARRDRYEFLRQQLRLKRIDLKNLDNVREIK